MMDTMRCFVLMPFSKDFTFVYKYGIEASLAELESETKLTFEHLRADEILTLQADKLPEILQHIERSDFIIIDITGQNPNVLWELGFCRALEKHIVVLSQKTVDLPFNIRGLDIQKYDFSTDGMERLKVELVKKLRARILEVQKDRRALRFDQDVVDWTKGVQRTLGTISRDSLLQNLAKNEIERLYGRIRELRNGTFELRNEKPNSEIIKYFCDYIKQLDDSTCEYCTVSNASFWREITENGNQLDFWFANLQALRLGAKIRRVFVLDKRSFPEHTVIRDDFLRKLLERHHNDKSDNGERAESRIVFTENYDNDVVAFGNFGLLKKGNERLLFKPHYSDDGRMTKTVFEYHTGDDGGRRNAEQIGKNIRDFQAKFDIMWSNGKALNAKHFT